MMDPHEAHAIRHLWVSVAITAIMDAIKEVYRERVYLSHVPTAPKTRLENIVTGHAKYFMSKDWLRVSENAGISIKTEDIIDLLYKAPNPKAIRNLHLVQR